jgi:putative flavoprotein involved in K+ transport
MTNAIRDNADSTITNDARAARRKPTSDSGIIAGADEEFPVVVIGGGQAGLSVGHHLKRRGIRFVILDANARIGDQWRRRWDSLRLFTAGRYDGLDGMRFPAPRHAFPTKDEMADFLEAYAKRFELPVEHGARVDKLRGENGRYVVTAGKRRWLADQVVVAMSDFQRPKVPPFASKLNHGIIQMHSSEYRGPEQLVGGGVLIVGAGNSGSEIAKEVARAGHPIWMSGRDTGHIPFRIEGFLGRHLFVPLVLRILFYRILTIKTPIGRRARPKVLSHGGPLIRVKPKDLAALGVERVPRTAGVRDGRPVLEDGRVLDVTNVVWCTGYHPGFDWIELPAFNGRGAPDHRRGVATNQPGLYFTGLEFLYSISSVMIQGAGRDARHVVDRIAERIRASSGH